MSERQIADRLAEIQAELEKLSHLEGEASIKVSKLIHELCDMRDAGLISQIDVSMTCYMGKCYCPTCTLGG